MELQEAKKMLKLAANRIKELENENKKLHEQAEKNEKIAGILEFMTNNGLISRTDTETKKEELQQKTASELDTYFNVLKDIVRNDSNLKLAMASNRRLNETADDVWEQQFEEIFM